MYTKEVEDNEDDQKARDLEATQEKALNPIQEIRINFHGDELLVVLVEVGGEHRVYVPLRQFCECLGLNWPGQYSRIQRDDVLASETIIVAITTALVPIRGQRESYPTLCLPLYLLPGWLFGITPSRVKPSLALKLHRYRKECFRVLWQAFQQGRLWQNTQEVDSSEAEIYSWLARGRERVWRARERAIQIQLPATLTVEQWLRTLEHFRWRCAYCEQRPGVIIEHFIPLPLAGTTAENCVPSCYACNSKKGNIHPDFVTTIPRQVLNTIQAYLSLISVETSSEARESRVALGGSGHSFNESS